MRKEITVAIADNGNELRFRIKQMPATKQERWIMRALLLVARSGIGGMINVPDGKKLGELKMTQDLKFEDMLKALGQLNYEDVEPLMEELLNCCTRISDSGAEQVCTGNTIDGYVSDLKTLLKLRQEVLKLHFSFFQNAANSPDSEAQQRIVISKSM